MSESKSHGRASLSTKDWPKNVGLTLKEQDLTISNSHSDIYNIRTKAVHEERRSQSSSQTAIANMERG